MPCIIGKYVTQEHACIGFTTINNWTCLKKKSIAFKNIWIFIQFLLIKQLISYRNALHNYVHTSSYMQMLCISWSLSNVYHMSICILYLSRDFEILKLSS